MQADEERDFLNERKRELTRRRRLLQLRWDRQGDAVDPAIPAEIEDIDRNLAGIEATLTAYDMAAVPKPAPDAIARVRDRYDDSFDFLIAQVASITARQTRSEDRQANTEAQVQDIAGSLAQWVAGSQEWREMIGEQVVAIAIGQRDETAKREWGQRRNLFLSVAAIVLMLLIAGLLLWILR